MKFLVDRCAGRKIADWLRSSGHDVREARELVPDPGDAALLRLASAEARILVTLDSDFGALVHLEQAAHAGIIRLPDVPANDRVLLMRQILERYGEAELRSAIVTAKGNRIRFSGV